MADALRPDAFYPQIQSNGAVSTDEEDNSVSESSSDEESSSGRNNGGTAPGRRKPGSVPTHHHLRRLNYNPRSNHRVNGNLFAHNSHLQSTVTKAPPSKPQSTTARLARDDEDMRVGPAKA